MSAMFQSDDAGESWHELHSGDRVQHLRVRKSEEPSSPMICFLTQVQTEHLNKHHVRQLPPNQAATRQD